MVMPLAPTGATDEPVAVPVSAIGGAGNGSGTGSGSGPGSGTGTSKQRGGGKITPCAMAGVAAGKSSASAKPSWTNCVICRVIDLISGPLWVTDASGRGNVPARFTKRLTLLVGFR